MVRQIYDLETVEPQEIPQGLRNVLLCIIRLVTSKQSNTANAMLSKIRHFADQKTLKAIYHAIFESHLRSSSSVWAQNIYSTKRLFILQKKALRFMFFLKREVHTNPLFKDFNIL